MSKQEMEVKIKEHEVLISQLTNLLASTAKNVSALADVVKAQKDRASF